MVPIRLRARDLLPFLLLVLALAPLLGSPAAAQEAPQLDGAVTDLTGDLSDEPDLEAAVPKILDGSGLLLYVLLVADTGGASISAFARNAWDANSLGDNEVVLVLARDAASGAFWAGGQTSNVTSAELKAIAGQVVKPALAGGDLSEVVLGEGAGQ